MKKVLTHSKFHLGVIVSLCAILVWIWFRDGFMVGSGESGLPFHNFERLIPRTFHQWSDALLGSLSNTVSIIFLGAIGLISRAGISSVFIQAMFYFFILAVGAVSVYKLAYLVSEDKFASFFSSVFYLFNPFTMVTVINRLQYTFMFFYALYPLSFYLFVKGIIARKYVYAFLVVVASVAFSLSFASFPFLILWFITLGSFVLFNIARNLKKNLFFSTKYFGITLITWILFHAWWFFPTMYSTFATPYASTEAVTQTGNIQSFVSVSQAVGGMPFVLRLLDKSFIYQIGDSWGINYLNPIVNIIGFIPGVVCLLSVFKRKKSSLFKYFLIFSLFALMFSKGVSDALGNITLFFFSNIRFLEVFRNPFEKAGFALMLSYSILFGVGLSMISKFLASKAFLLKYTLVILVSLVLFFYYVLPMWNGRVFGGKESRINSYVQVPSFYKDADNWLKTLGEGFRVVALPIDGEGMTYSWDRPFNGVELSSELFSTPFISFATSVPYLEPITSTLEPVLFQNTEAFPSVLGTLGSKYFLLRRDINYPRRAMRDPRIIEDYVEALVEKGDLTLSREFEDLRFYELSGENFVPLFSTPRNVVTMQSSKYLFFDKINTYPNKDTIAIVDPLLSGGEKYISARVLRPTRQFQLNPGRQINVDEARAQLPAIRYLPTDRFYPLILLKESIERMALTESSARLLYDLQILGKRMIEVDAVKNGSQETLELAVKRYKDLLLKLSDEIIRESGREQFMKDLFVETFNKHFVVLSSAQKELSLENQKILLALESYMSGQLQNMGLRSFYPRTVGLSEASRIYQFRVENKGDYMINLYGIDSKGTYEYPKMWEIALDGKPYTIEPQVDKKFLKIGSFYFDTGDHEINIPIPELLNLVDIPTEKIVDVSTDNHPRFEINNFNPYSTYKISFDYLIKKGDKFEVILVDDLNVEKENEERQIINSTISIDGYNYYWKRYETTVSPNRGSSRAWVEFDAEKFDFCPRSNFFLTYKCDDVTYRSRFEKPVEVEVKNLRVERLFLDSLILVNEELAAKEIVPPQISFKKYNPTYYEIKVSNATTPYFLSFRQLFHPSWKIKINENGEMETVPPHVLVDGFANGWYLDKLGSYTLIVEFQDEKILIIGRIISLVSVVSFLGLGVFSYAKKTYFTK